MEGMDEHAQPESNIEAEPETITLHLIRDVMISVCQSFTLSSEPYESMAGDELVPRAVLSACTIQYIQYKHITEFSEHA